MKIRRTSIWNLSLVLAAMLSASQVAGQTGVIFVRNNTVAIDTSSPAHQLHEVDDSDLRVRVGGDRIHFGGAA